jgi:hypothetical protein
MDQNEFELEPRHLGVPSGASEMIFQPMVLLAQTVHLSSFTISTISKRTDTNIVSKRIETRFHMTHVT